MFFTYFEMPTNSNSANVPHTSCSDPGKGHFPYRQCLPANWETTRTHSGQRQPQPHRTTQEKLQLTFSPIRNVPTETKPKTNYCVVCNKIILLSQVRVKWLEYSYRLSSRVFWLEESVTQNRHAIRRLVSEAAAGPSSVVLDGVT